MMVSFMNLLFINSEYQQHCAFVDCILEKWKATNLKYYVQHSEVGHKGGFRYREKLIY